MLEAERKTPYHVLKIHPRMRDLDDIKIFTDYCQKFELLAKQNTDFYQYLHLGVRVVEDFKKGEIIEPDVSVVRILWQGLVEPVLPEGSFSKRKEQENSSLYYQLHTIIIND